MSAPPGKILRWIWSARPQCSSVQGLTTFFFIKHWFLGSTFPQFQVHLQFWSGVPTRAGWEAYDLEIYINNVHDEHMIGPFCGFDQWIDNHIAIDAGPGEVSLSFGLWIWLMILIVINFSLQDGTGPTLDKLVPLLEQGGYHYHIWGGLAHIFIRLFRSDSIMFHWYH